MGIYVTMYLWCLFGYYEKCWWTAKYNYNKRLVPYTPSTFVLYLNKAKHDNKSIGQKMGYISHIDMVTCISSLSQCCWEVTQDVGLSFNDTMFSNISILPPMFYHTVRYCSIQSRVELFLKEIKNNSFFKFEKHYVIWVNHKSNNCH